MDTLQNNKLLLIHIGVELLIVGGVTFWLNSKISAKDETIARLEKENKEIMERLMRIEMFLQGKTPPKNVTPPTKGPPVASKSDDESVVDSDEDIDL